MTLSSALFGTPGRIEALPTLTPEQQQLLGSLIGGLGGPMQTGLSNLQRLLMGEAEAFEAPAMRQFREQIIPGIAERFTGGFPGIPGAASAQRSSAFQQALGQAGASLAERLAMQRAGLQERGLSQLQSLLGLGMAPAFQYQAIPGVPGGLSQLLGGLGGGLGMGAGGWLSSRLFGLGS